MTTQTLEQPAQRTCVSCPYFQNFGEASGRGWCQIFDQMARQHHERTGACDQEIEALEKEPQQQPVPSPEPQPQRAGFAGDAVSCQLQPTQSALTEFEQGRCHGRADASERLRPMYTEPSDTYAAGYLEGYNSILKPTQQPEIIKQAEWSVSFNSRWGWYEAWVGSRCIGKGASYQEAESVAQRYIATDEIIQRQNWAVLAAYAG